METFIVLLQIVGFVIGAVFVVVVALQTSKSEGLSGILAGGGGAGGKVGRERHLEAASLYPLFLLFRSCC